MATLTAANSVYILTVPGIFNAPQQLQGYATDDAFDTDASAPAEVMIGVDGLMSAGYVPFLTKQTITLQADSPSVLMFEDWLAFQKSARDVYQAYGKIILPNLGRAYTMTSGVLTSIISIPGTKKTMQPRRFEITWGSIDPAPV